MWIFCIFVKIFDMRHLYDPNFYTESRNGALVMHYEMRLKDEVDGEILEWAANFVRPRFPYFMVQVEQEGESLVVNPNPRPVVVRKGNSNPIPLCSKESNYHVVAITYEDKTIYFDMCHAVSDGQGRLPWVKSLMYYYLTKKYGVELDPTGIYLVDTPISDEEYGNPFPEIQDDIKPFFVSKNHKAEMYIEEFEYAQADKTPSMYFVNVDENDMMRVAKSSDGTPAIMFSLFFTKAIYEVHKDKTKFPIMFGMAQSHRPGLGCPKNSHFLSGAFFMGLPERSMEYDLTTLATICRGQIMLNTDKQNSLVFAHNILSFAKYLESFPTLAEKRAAARQTIAYNMPTFFVSYVGKIDYGSVTPYIESVYPHIVQRGCPVMEINAMNGQFNIGLAQNFKSDVYVRMFVKLMEDAGIKVNSVRGPEKSTSPIVDLD